MHFFTPSAGGGVKACLYLMALMSVDESTAGMGTDFRRILL